MTDTVRPFLGGCVLKRVFVLLAFVGILLASGCQDYSEGYRDGHIQKLSYKGTFPKSWEGELALPGAKSPVGNNTAASNVWEFSVEESTIDPDSRKSIVDALKDVPGDELVRLHYREEPVGSSKYHTPYRITRVVRITKRTDK